jgi:hypothetical protein
MLLHRLFDMFAFAAVDALPWRTTGARNADPDEGRNCGVLLQHGHSFYHAVPRGQVVVNGDTDTIASF